jgi:hypothetical protein
MRATFRVRNCRGYRADRKETHPASLAIEQRTRSEQESGSSPHVSSPFFRRICRKIADEGKKFQVPMGSVDDNPSMRLFPPMRESR